MKYTFEKKAKLVGKVGSGKLWLLNIEDDWIHDQYGESHIYHGRIHSSKKAFHPLSTTISGYFQDEDTQKWIKLKYGVATVDPANLDHSWKTDINQLVKISINTGVYQHYKTGTATAALTR
ncbi:MAG: hypothetical protein K0S25_1508 [Bacillus sp. (in: firmicutes)]|jgi:hypothetical protein|nr:hypothetical protein [Bacillus sp. (in: firmicutes)]